MKNLLFLVVLTIVLSSCATSNKTANKSINNAIIGQNEMVVFERLGTPTSIEHFRDGGKVMVYESVSKGMFLTPYNKPAITYNFNKNLIGGTQGLTYTRNVNTAVNDPKYTIHPSYSSYLKVYIDKHGNAIRIEKNLPQEQLEIYHERFKHFHPYQR